MLPFLRVLVMVIRAIRICLLTNLNLDLSINDFKNYPYKAGLLKAEVFDNSDRILNRVEHTYL